MKYLFINSSSEWLFILLVSEAANIYIIIAYYFLYSPFIIVQPYHFNEFLMHVVVWFRKKYITMHSVACNESSVFRIHCPRLPRVSINVLLQIPALIFIKNCVQDHKFIFEICSLTYKIAEQFCKGLTNTDENVRMTVE